MTDLVQWLTAQLDEDERVARKAASLCGCHPAAPVWLFGDESTDGRIVIAGDPHPDVRRKLSRRWSGSYDGLFAAEHVARHDPARVLREVEAKRKMIDYLVDLESKALDGNWWNLDTEPPLRLLALPYSDRPGYQESWRP